MRYPRIKVLGRTAYYHCISRCVNGEFLLKDNKSKRILVNSIKKAADFCGVQLLTYCVMDNHFHVLIKVPFVISVSDEELMRRYCLLYPEPTKYQAAKAEVLKAELAANSEEGQEFRTKMLKRMHDISQFMKMVKERYTKWYNSANERFGTMWAERFKSILVGDKGNSLCIMSAYIDLNPLRACLVDDPKDYLYSGYGEAVRG